MNPMPMIRSACDCLNSIVLRPKLTLSLSSFNRRTGSFSEQKSISLSAGITLLRGIMLLAGGMGVAYGAMMLCRAGKKKKPCRSMKKSRRRL
ncbi:MAG: hypothetical protein E7580_01010 [Ruminococcaceae bacterium]|nr:hypothetical protein [Oscillospiraceae bacterium]